MEEFYKLRLTQSIFLILHNHKKVGRREPLELIPAEGGGDAVLKNIPGLQDGNLQTWWSAFPNCDDFFQMILATTHSQEITKLLVYHIGKTPTVVLSFSFMPKLEFWGREKHTPANLVYCGPISMVCIVKKQMIKRSESPWWRLCFYRGMEVKFKFSHHNS